MVNDDEGYRLAPQQRREHGGIVFIVGPFRSSLYRSLSLLQASLFLLISFALGPEAKTNVNYTVIT